MTKDGLITDRGIIRDSAPDILLTNYKMLDQLLLRHEDQRLWQQSATSLQYLVLDEFHTYDGAQGTDVAMLLRRLGLALKSHWPEGSASPEELACPLGRITPVATSATLGDQGDAASMIEFARTVFGDDIDAASVIAEERLTLEEWAADAEATVAALGLKGRELARADLAAVNESLATVDLGDAHGRTLQVLAALYAVPVRQLERVVGREPAGFLPLLQAHPLVRKVVSATASAVHLADLADQLFGDPAAPGASDGEHVTFLTHLVAALSHVRATVGRAALTVDLHLWVRELTRIDRLASSAAEYRWSDDGALAASGEEPFGGQARPVFPAIYCRHCGRSGWGVELAAVGANLAPEDTSIRRHHATHEGRFRALLYAPLEADHAAGNGGAAAPVEGLRWFSIRQRMLLNAPPADDDRDAREGWVLPVLTQVGQDADAESHADTCPSCQQRDAIRFLGSAIATLLSVTLSTLFGAEHLDAAEKKALVFTDSVQDAAHRAGFVESRSHVLTLRSVLRAAVDDAPVTLDALVGEAIRQAGDDRFRRFRLVPPELAERDEFAPFWRKDSVREVSPTILTRVKRRLLFDAVLEFGLQSRVGRTLEQTGSVVVEVEAGQPAKLAAIGRAVLDKAEVQEGLDTVLAAVPDARVVAWVRGTLEHLRGRGAIEHEWFSRFLREDGNRYRIWGGRPRGQGMPAFPKGRAAPGFPRIGSPAKWKDPLLDPGATGVPSGRQGAVGGLVPGPARPGSRRPARLRDTGVWRVAGRFLRPGRHVGRRGVAVPGRGTPRRGRHRIDPHALGRVLGLDRAPEVKTIRRKISQLAAHGKAEDLLAAMAAHHLAHHQNDVQTGVVLYVDGHVRAYQGTRKIAKTHAARLKFPAPATVETWISDGHGDPVLVVMAEPAASLAGELRRLLPTLRQAVGDDRRVLVGFDRGGWSPALFAHLSEHGFDPLTWRKQPAPDIDPGLFTPVAFTDEHGRVHEWQAADTSVDVPVDDHGGTFTMRQLTRLLDTKTGTRQAHILTTRTDLSAGDVLYRMGSRWRQENYFRYARMHFALDAHDSYTATVDDPARMVPNPAKKTTRDTLASARNRLDRVQAATDAALLEWRTPKPGESTMMLTSADHNRITDPLWDAEQALTTAHDAHANTPARLPLAQVNPGQQVLDVETKLLTHAVRIAAFNTITSLARDLRVHTGYARAADEAHTLIRQALTGSGDIIPGRDTLTIRLDPLPTRRATTALTELREHLTNTGTRYPGTNLVLRYQTKTRS